VSVDYQGASAEAIEHHYDVGNEFYALWLDESLTYSCALWDGPEDTLADAQRRKLDYLLTGAQVAGAERILDVGCGWGALLRRSVEEYGVKHGTGLTLSRAQAGYVQGRTDDRYDIRVENWIDHEPGQPYDAIVSIGAFEHFADFGMTRDVRIAAYRRFFDACHRWLPRGGRLALQTIVKGNNTRMTRQMVKDLLFIADEIFPESELPWPSEIFEASERRFDVVSVRNDPDHYARTCLHWLDGLKAHRDEAVELAGEKIVADYERYLDAGAEAFTERHLGLMRLVFERV
jgi:cyclopropane-fatty-acyl-phospholipid synthase